MLLYQPSAGSVVRCNFEGYKVPEITKSRPVLIIHKHKTNPKLVTVVPLSKTAPEKEEFYHLELDLLIEKTVKPYLSLCKRWFKCDLVYVVSIERMDRLHHAETKERYVPCVSSKTLKAVKEMVRLSNGLY